jgi:hypothetical protein
MVAGPKIKKFPKEILPKRPRFDTVLDRFAPSNAVCRTRTLAPIPPDPKPTKMQIEAELRNDSFTRSLPTKLQRGFATLSWEGSQRHEFPNKFWHPFAPSGYDAYLRSDVWRRISRRIKTEAGNKCACCPNKATQVHHRCYRPRVMTGEDMSLLIALCADCHKTVDFDERGKVRDAHSKERTLAEMFDRESKRLAGIAP